MSRRGARCAGGLAVVTVVSLAAFSVPWAEAARQPAVPPADEARPAAPPAGVVTFERPLPKEHVDGSVAYDVIPPVGGPHWDIWMNCGFYGDWESWPDWAQSSPVITEAAVHSLEHGAVWITYDARAHGHDDLEALRRLAQRPHVLVSPWPDPDALPSPLVASAWGAQLRLGGVDDPRLEQFTDYYRQHPDAPEPHGACDGGVGDPQ